MRHSITILTLIFTLVVSSCSSQDGSNKIDVPASSGVAERETPDEMATPRQEIQAQPEQREELPPPPPGQKRPDEGDIPKLELAPIVKNDGKKWKVNEEVVEAVEKIDEYVDLFLLKEKPTEEDYIEFALGVRDRQNKVFESSTVKPPADIHLQEFLLKVDEMVMHVESGEPAMRAAAMETLHKQLHVFPIYFEAE